MRAVKNRTFEEKGSAAEAGHNVKERLDAQKAVTQRVMKLEAERVALAGEIKDALNEHKKAWGTPKGSIRKAAKTLILTEESFQAKKEVDTQAEEIVQYFVDSDGQYSFLDKNAA